MRTEAPEVTGQSRRLLLRFGVWLQTGGRHAQSLLFHRWCPDGEKDSLALNTGKDFAKLTVWFEPRECSNASLSAEKLTDEEIPRVGVIASGPLHGSLELSGGFSDEELEAVIGDTKGPAYESLGKKIANKWIGPPLIDFLSILRLNYGQYWIDKFELWNSEKETIGSYCRTRLNLRWRTADGAAWKEFEPGEAVTRLVAVAPAKETLAQYLTPQDWAALSDAVDARYKPPLAAMILTRAHQAADTGSLSDGFVIAVTALQIAITELFREIELKEKGRESLQQKLLKAVSLSADVEKGQLRLAIKAISMRNTIVHAGFEPKGDSTPCLYALIAVTGSLLPGPKFIFPSAHHGNLEMPAEEWEKDGP